MKDLYVFMAVLKKYYIELKRYAFNTVMMMGGIYILFALVFFGMQSFNATTETLESTIVGFALWIFAILGFSELSWSILEEARNGTLEQLYISPVSFGRISGYRVLASFIVNLVLMSAFLMAMMVGTGHYLNLDPGVLILVFLTLLSVYGIGYIMGGLALIFKKVQATLSIFQFLFIVLLMIPAALDIKVVYMLPVSWGSILINRVMVSGTPFLELPLNSLLILILNSLAYFFMGYLVFGYLEKIAKQKGLLGHY